MPRRPLAMLITILLLSAAAHAGDEAVLRTAERLAGEKRFAESEALYRRVLAREPQSQAARLGLARVVMWQGRYAEAIARFGQVEGIEALEGPQAPDGIEALEGRATAEYWSGDLRAAARDFRRVLTVAPGREFSRTSLRDIEANARPSQRVTVDTTDDDQPLDVVRAESVSTFFSDPLTRWSVSVGAYRFDAGRIGQADGQSVTIENETGLGDGTFGGKLGLFTFPDGVRRPVGSVSVRRRALLLRVDRRQEMDSAPSLRTHASATTTTLRWSHDRGWIGVAEISDRRYFDGNHGQAAVAYAVAPLRRGLWTLWGGASATAGNTRESRFRMTAVSSTREQGLFRYQYRGEYDPYWSPDDLLEGRVVVAVERREARGGVKVHADAGYGRDHGRAFGPDAGPDPFPATTFTFAFDRTFRPWRAGITADFTPSPRWRIEAGIERSVTVDYRSTFLHAALVRRY